MEENGSEINPMSDRPVEATSGEEVAAVKEVVLQKKRVSIKEIMAGCKLSYGIIENILRELLSPPRVTKLSAPKRFYRLRSKVV